MWIDVVIVGLIRLMLVVHTLTGNRSRARRVRELLTKVHIGRMIERRDVLTRHWGVGVLSEHELFARALARPARRHGARDAVG